MKAKRTLLAPVVLLLLSIGAAAICIPYDPPRLTLGEIRQRVDALNENAAVVTPHRILGRKKRQSNLVLFMTVERGGALSKEDSATYRQIYQSILKDNQALLAIFDSNLTVLNDVEMQATNNVHGHGIAGSHDHHDASANSNFASLERALFQMEQTDGAMSGPARIGAAISANKDLTDIILHMATAPQTKSVGYRRRGASTELERAYESMMIHFKRAQFAPVNSAEYVAEVHLALDSYDALVLLVQDRMFEELTPLERTIGGRWGNWKSFGPSVDKHPVRIPRDAHLRPASYRSPPSRH